MAEKRSRQATPLFLRSIVQAARGTLVHVGARRSTPPRITVVDYNSDSWEEEVVSKPEGIRPMLQSEKASWISVDGVHDTAFIEAVGAALGCHPLLLEDIVNTAQRPKVDDYEQYLFVVLKAVQREENTGTYALEQVSLLLGRHVLVSFQEGEGGLFSQVRQQLRDGKAKLRELDADHLFSHLLDAVVDGYASAVEALGTRVEALETLVLESAHPSDATPTVIHQLLRDILLLRKVVVPVRDLMGSLSRTQSPLLSDAARPYLRDVEDHVIQVLDILENYRDVVTLLDNHYFSTVSARMNGVMKLLTMIATIFIPLTFVTGIYGMNFIHMPEIDEPWAYPTVLLAMLGIGLVMVAFFRRKGWL